MSYDVFVFDPDGAPREHAAFLGWFEAEVRARDGVFSNDPAMTSERLQSWFAEMALSFPAVDGPAAPADIEDRVKQACDYMFRPHSIYACFSWPGARDAAQLSFEAAKRQGVGVVDVGSSREDVYWPVGGGFEVERGRRGGLLRRLFRRR